VGRLFPPLKASATVQQKEPTSVIRVILEGARTVATASEPTAVAMPAFGWKLSDAQIAAVATFVRNSWGNQASTVSEDDVKSLRKTLRTSMLPNAK
jgi:mono/diheme cytochrome c family protein